ncbi:acetate/propionate family kinase [Paucibacter sp. APW11]|uniref:Acetate kinase n=1 Tax=Roseateles aquae TaxID=3077235 RepID=A0ABU3PEU0_9BURK|nr:acetate/propionate family kinase [Paucibacter sp. APW11]MDT9001076.1 acetate/propionate family kinase [Paucibacter sp. APW11]
MSAPASADGGTVLAVNAGSSSLKYGLYGREGKALWTGCYEGLQPGGQAQHRQQQPLPGLPEPLNLGANTNSFDAALADLLARLDRQGALPLAIAHRIVHGGERCVAPCRLDAGTMAYLHSLSPLAPLHQPHNLAGVNALARLLPRLPQIGCFDTAFHAEQPAVEQWLPLPRALRAQGLRRYGFHGLSYQYLSETLARHSRRSRGRAILAHLGNGASVCATLDGSSIASSMGFSALDGLMMGSRSGAVDPGALLHLLRQGWSVERLEQTLYKASGLLGVSGLSADMRTLRASPEAAAAEAIALFCHRLRREAAALLAPLQGLDLLAFTGGIGEHDAGVREALCDSLGFLGLQLDRQRNAAASGQGVQALHSSTSAVEVWLVPTDEGRVAASAAWRWLDAEARSAPAQRAASTLSV